MILFIIVGLVVAKFPFTSGQDALGQSGRLGHRPSYVIVAPRRVRPDMVVQIHVTTFVLNAPHLTVRAAVSKDGVEYATTVSSFTSGSSRLVQMKMPGNAVAGNYTLHIDGSSNGGYGSFIFQNETLLMFNPKRVSVFISTDKRIYYKRKTIYFRVVALHPNLLPVMSGSIHIFIKDGAGQIVRRWLSQQISHGYYEGSFGTEHPCKHGWWSIVVEGWGYTYKAHRFKTENYYRTKTDINVTMPAYVLDNEYALAGVIIANQTTGRPVHGNATIQLEIRPTGMTNDYPIIKKEISQFTGRYPFQFTLAEMRQKVERLTGAQLVVSATVVDWYFIELKTERAISYVIDSGVKVRFLGGRVRVFKPGNPLKVFIAVYGHDGSKYTPNRYRQVVVHTLVRKTTGETRIRQEKKYIVPDNSIVKHSYTPESDDEMITIRAAHEGVSLKYEEMTAWKHFTRRDEHIYMSMSTAQPVVDNYAVITVRSSIYVPQIYYMVVTGGNIITTNTVFMKFRQKTFSLALSRDMVPNAKIVAYCVLNTGEILADSLAFVVKGIRNDGVRLNINRGKDFSGNTAEVNAFADPASFIAFSATQYQMYEPGANQFFREYDVEEDLSGYDDHTNNSFSHTWLYDEARKEKVHYPAPSYAVDANTTFTFAGLIVFTDAELRRMPAALECNLTRGSLPCYDGTCYQLEQRCDGVRQCEDGADELGCADEREAVFRPALYKTLARLESHLDDSTWAWKSFYTKPYGRIDFRINLPMRPLLWVIGAFSLHHERGLAFAEYPVRVDTARPFFIKVELPKAAVKGEQLGVQIAVFNYWTQPIEATLTLKGSKQYKFIRVQDGGYVRSYNPKTADGDVQTMVKLIPGESLFIHFPIVILDMGKVKVTVCAESSVNRQQVTKTVTIRYDGITNVYQTPYLIDLVSKGSVIIPSFEIVTPERFVYPEQRRHLYVPGSPEATLTIVGDIVGPGFTTPRLDIRHLMRATHGDGENYIFNFAINWYWLAYLKATDQLSSKLMGKVLDGLNKDMQAVYAFIQPNGGFANRRRRSPTDTWTTTLAIEFLSLAATQPEWEDVLYIDVNIINKLALWLCSQQNVTTGAFPRTSYVYDIKMHTNLTNADGLEMNMSMTAYAVIALSRSVPVLTGEAQKKAVVAKNMAADYLAQHFDALYNAFDVCLVTYALHEANHISKGEVFRKMRAIKISGEFVYWSDKPVKSNPTKIINTVPIMQARPTSPVYHAFAVHATAFALLVYLRNNWVVEALPIMKWLQTQRNFNGGFSAPEDTLRATQALVEYALRDTNRDLYNMVINIEASSTPNWKQSVHLRRGTFSDINIIKVPNSYGYVRTTAQGTGLALIQLSTKYNVEYIDQLRKPFQRAFDLQVENLHFWGRNASHMEMTVCARWVRTDIAETSGAAVLEVDIPTGYHTQKQLLRRHQWTGPIYSLRSRFVHQKVVLYFEYLNSSRSCWYFTAERWYPVANMTIQNRVRIYSTYEPALHNTTIYTTMNLFHLHICQVCGSFQCPYCPFYNPASRPHSQATTALIILIALLTLYHLHADQLGQSVL